MAEVTSRYARALAEVVEDKRLIPGRVREQLRSVVGVVESSAELRKVWESPAIPAEQKRALLDSIAGKLAVDTIIRNFIAVLIDHHRIPMLGRIARQFESEMNARLGIAEADIVSARDLSPDERQALESQIGQMTGKSVRANYSIDKNLLGGAMVRLGSTVYDGSVRGQLHKLKEALSAE
jgi:F-type H+-transporting ATPase subunit delta